MVTNKPLGISLYLLLLITLVIAGCSAQPAPTPTPAAPLRIGANQWVGYGPVDIAVDKGMFKKAGVNVELVPYASLDLANIDFAAQKLDGNLTTLTDGVALAAHLLRHFNISTVSAYTGEEAITALAEQDYNAAII